MIETSVAFISLIEKDILRIEYKEDSYVDLEEFAENLEAYKKLMTTPRVYLLTVVREGSMLSPEVRNEFSRPERSSFKIAEAFVLKTMAHKILANFVLRVQRPRHTLKFFVDEREALDWLLMQKKENEKAG